MLITPVRYLRELCERARVTIILHLSRKKLYEKKKQPTARAVELALCVCVCKLFCKLFRGQVETDLFTEDVKDIHMNVYLQTEDAI